MTTKILYQGQVHDPSGYAVAGRGYIRSMRDYIQESGLDIDFRVISISADSQKTLTEDETEMLEDLSFKDQEEADAWINTEDYHYIFHHPPVYALKLPVTAKLASKSLSTTCFTVWETDELPKIWIQILDRFDVDRIVVPCVWNRDSFEKSLRAAERDIPVLTVPHLINDDFVGIQENQPKVEGPLKEQDFNVLTVGQWTDRKALMNVVKAFMMEFKNEPSCVLSLKTYGNIQNSDPEYQTQQQQIMINQIQVLKRSILGDDLESPPQCKLHFMYGLYPKEQMNYLYKSADLFALFSRAEGFGLPIAEAIAHETPVIVHDSGGHVDFTDPDSNFLVDSYLTPSHCTIFPFVYSCDSNWFETDYLSARKQLRAAFEEWKNDRETFNSRGPSAKEYMLKITGDSVAIGKQLVEYTIS